MVRSAQYILERMTEIERDCRHLRTCTDDLEWKVNPLAIEYRQLLCDWWRTVSNADAYQAIYHFRELRSTNAGRARYGLDITDRGLTYKCSTSLEMSRQGKLELHVTEADRTYVTERKQTIAVAKRLLGRTDNV